MIISRERLSLYKEAEAIAVSNNDSSRARRFNRGVKTLADLERRAVAGHPIREDDIPPVISVGKRKDDSSSDSTPASEMSPIVATPSGAPTVVTPEVPPKPVPYQVNTQISEPPPPPVPTRGKL